MPQDLSTDPANGLSHVTAPSAQGRPDSYRPRQVLKFGGTVCGKLPNAVAEICSSALEEGPIAIVCSARSGRGKDVGTTNLLLRAFRAAIRGQTADCDGLLDVVLEQHRQGAHEVLSATASERYFQSITKLYPRLREILHDLAHDDSITDERLIAEDQVMSFGELFSATFYAMLLNDRGIPAELVDLSQVMESPLDMKQDFYSTLSPILEQKIHQCGGSVPVLTGFFGKVQGGLLKSCGRGYSDVLSAIVAGATKAKELQIWKEVDGVKTADPSKVHNALLIDYLHPEEARELTFYGSEVIHHFTMDICMNARIPIRIKNAHSPQGPGTAILPQTHPPNAKRPRLRPRKPNGDRRPTAVTSKKNITVVNVHSHRKASAPEFLVQICQVLAHHGVTVDLFELNESHVSLAVHTKSALIPSRDKPEGNLPEAENRMLQLAIEELRFFGSVDIRPNMAILSLIGDGMKRYPGTAGKFFTILGKHRINIEMISQGASEINISCVIQSRDAVRAVNTIHTEFFIHPNES